MDESNDTLFLIVGSILFKKKFNKLKKRKLAGLYSRTVGSTIKNKVPLDPFRYVHCRIFLCTLSYIFVGFFCELNTEVVQ